jgi:N-methylhydantoinase B
VLADDVVVSLSSERQHVPAPGLAGGDRGARGAFVLNPDSHEACTLPSAAADVKLPRDSVLRISTPGGGGYGPLDKRDPAALERDVREDRNH